MPRFLVATVFFFFSIQLFAQNDVVYVYGYVKDDNSQLKMQGVTVALVEDGKVLNTYVTPLNGKFELDLAFDHAFELRFSKDGFVTKFIRIDTRNVPKENRVGGFGFDVDIALFQIIEGVNFDLFKQPVGIAKYSAAKGDMDFDLEYTRAFLAKIEELKKSYRKKVQEEEDRLKKEQLAAEQEKLKQEKFELLVKEGDALASSANFTNAIFKFTEALDLKPGTKFVQDKLAAAQKALDELNLLKQKEVNYKEAIAAADKAFAAKNYKQAIADYNKALNHKPTEAYPKTRINEAESILADQAKQDALNKQYTQSINKADSVFKLNKFEQSIPLYEAALKLKPAETYPQQKIGEAKTKLDELAKQKALDDKYKAAITAGDLAMRESRFQDAIASFQEAKALKGTELYSAQKITEAQGKLDEQARQKSLNDQYTNDLASADQLFNQAKYAEAIDIYKKAGALKPTEVYPKTKITEAQTKLAAIAKQDAQDKQYAALIAKGDQQFTNKDFYGAQTTFQQAQALKPGEQYPKTKLEEVNAELDVLAQQKALDTQYNGLIVKADQAYTAKQYEAALKTYQQAQGLKPAESYPKQKITELEGLLAEQAKQKETDKKYQAIVTKADSAFKATRYSDAIGLYNQALEVKEAEMYPKTKIVEANTKLNEIAKKDALEQQYKDLLTKADGEFAAQNYPQAINTYKEASVLKPVELYPKNRITEAQKKQAEIDKKSADDATYSKLIGEGDAEMTAKNYTAASAKYQSATVLKPTEQYPKDQLALAKAKLDELAKAKALSDQYAGLITKADVAFTAQKWTDAIGLYQQALAIKAEEQYPKDKIAEANARLVEISKKKEELEDAYKKAVGLGDEAMQATDYVSAKTAFQQASQLKPTELYPKQKITEAEAKLAEQAKKDALDKQYNGLVERADLAFKNEDYTAALGAYQQAAAVKPTEQYPKTKVAETQKLIDELKQQKTTDAQYQAFITKGNTDMAALGFESALKNFEQALALKPTEQYPKDQIEICKIRLDELKAARLKEQNYKDALLKGDAAFGSKDYVAAITAYEEALDVKPTEVYPQDRIKLANAELAKMAQAKELATKYQAAVAQADSIFKIEKWQESIDAYKVAQGIKADETYPGQQIKLAQAKLTEIENVRLAREAKYNGFIQKGDSAFGKESYQVAKNYFAEAIRMKPSEQYPKDRMDAADAKLDEQAQNEADKVAKASLDALNKPVADQPADPTIVSFKDVTSFGDMKKDTAKAVVAAKPIAASGPKVMYRTAPGNGDLDDFRRKLGENYPEGRTEETFVEGNKRILRTVYVQNKLGDEYLKVVFSSGFGTFYFKNGDGIGPVDFENEIKRLK